MNPWHHEASTLNWRLTGGSELLGEKPLVRCPHGKEIVHGRWGCDNYSTELRKKEKAELLGWSEEDKLRELQELVVANKKCWEELGDRRKGEDYEAYYTRWAKIKRDSKYRVDYVKYIELKSPKLTAAKGARPHGDSKDPCPQGKMIDEHHLCKECWEANKQEKYDQFQEYNQQTKEILEPKLAMIGAMIGGYVAGDDCLHKSITWHEMRVEFDHTYSMPPIVFKDWNPSIKDKVKALLKS